MGGGERRRDARGEGVSAGRQGTKEMRTEAGRGDGGTEIRGRRGASAAYMYIHITWKCTHTLLLLLLFIGTCTCWYIHHTASDQRSSCFVSALHSRNCC